MFQAFLLEQRYSKEEILEMYANQFFVNGYGKGLRIASQYFFGKDAEDLDLVEAAFIVGSVKGPNRYNPFIKKTESRKEEARKLAKARKDYVLDKMLEQNFISPQEHSAAREKAVPFREGRITFQLNVVLDYIRNQLESEYFQNILREQGVENIATSGIRIYTSVDKHIQAAALASLRRHLPQMDVGLTGMKPFETLSRWKGPLEVSEIKDTRDNMPFLAQVLKVKNTSDNPGLQVAWKNGETFVGYDGLKPLGEAWLKSRMGSWAVFKKEHVPVFLNAFEAGQLIPVQPTLERDVVTGEVLSVKYNISAIPELEGAVVTLQKGMIKSMVGGFTNIYFNRAVDAKRQLGSIFKPILYASAIQLKWNILDPLENRKDVYRFEGTTYLPRPDHEPKSDVVSMAWAGAKSENLASVWLLYHLVDHLNMSEFRQVADIVGLEQKPDESYDAYRTRIRDQLGIIVNRDALEEAAFETAKTQVETDVIFAGYERVLPDIKRLHFDLEGTQAVFEKDDDRHILKYDFKRLQQLGRGLENENIQDSQTGEEIWVDGMMPLKVLKLLERQTRKQYEKLSSLKPYSMDVLYRIRDFKTLVGIQFVIYLSRKIGISTFLDPVLSLPLGPNAISIMEAALAYDTLLTGLVYPLGPGNGAGMVPVIKRIVDREGKLIWAYEPAPKKILSDRVTRLISEILRKVMESGTGRKAKGLVTVFDMPLPTFGKTGTANRYTNSSFVGLVPGPDKAGKTLNIENGYTIASYVGYDNNKPMKGKHLAIYGSSGALPLWIDTARAIAASKTFREGVQPADLVFNPLLRPASDDSVHLNFVPVSSKTGLPQYESTEGLDVLTEAEKQGNTWTLKRQFEPLEEGAK